jgi:hypothetical protein
VRCSRRLRAQRRGHANSVERDPATRDQPPDEHVSEAEKAARERSATDRNPDPETRRETLELDLMEDDRSEAGEEIGDEME